MKKSILTFSGLLICFFVYHVAQADTIDLNSTKEINTRYAGSIVKEDLGRDQHYWYIEPVTQERYALKDGLSISRLLKKFGQSIDNNTLAKIPADQETGNFDYNIVNQYRGKILIEVETNGEAWYVNPLDNRRYYIFNGQQGLATLQALALDINQDKLTAIPEAADPKFTPLPGEALNFDRYWQIWDILQNNYYQPEKADDQTLFFGSLTGLVDSLNDPYTQLFNARGRQKFEEELEGVGVEGIGAMVETKNGQLTVISPLNGSPAEAAGLLPGDLILQADDKVLKDLNQDEATSYIKGPAGTEVSLTIFRPSTQQTFTLNIVRAKIEFPTIIYQKLATDIAYFKINLFSLDLEEKFNAAREAIIDDNTKGVILDLRNNPGGYTSIALNFIDNFLPRDEIMLREKYPDQIDIYESRFAPTIELPIVILVNEGTASAAELTTAALSENGLAKIVGLTTFGKGTGQTVAYFPDGSALKYTLFEWLTPNGYSIEGKGITPDYIVADYDKQLNTAKDLLN